MDSESICQLLLSISIWMSNRHLRDNTSQTEHLTGPSPHPPKPASTAVCPISVAATLLFQWLKTEILESSLTPPFSHTIHLVYQRSCWLYLWNIYRIWPLLPTFTLLPWPYLPSQLQHLSPNGCPCFCPLCLTLQHSPQSDFLNKSPIMLFYYSELSSGPPYHSEGKSTSLIWPLRPVLLS